MRQKRSIGEYLAFLAIKYEVPPEEFLNALRIAENKKVIKCENLTVQLRTKLKDKSIKQVSKNNLLIEFKYDKKYIQMNCNAIKNTIQHRIKKLK